MMMNLRNVSGVLLAVAVVACVPRMGVSKDADSAYLSPLAIAADKEGKRLYVAEATARQIAVVNLQNGTVEKTVALPVNPPGVALSPDEKTLYVTGDAPQGNVYVISTEKCKIVSEMAVGHTPGAPIVTPNGSNVVVCNRFNNDVSVLDTAKGKEVARIKVVREPVAAVLAPNGRHLFVANMLPSGSADRDYLSASVSVVDLVSKNKLTDIILPNGSSSLHGLCLSPDGKYIYVTHVLSRYQLPTTQLERGWMNTAGLSIIDVATAKLVNTVLLDNVDYGAANPWGVACSSDGKWLCVAHAGTREISVIDRAGMHLKLEKLAKGEKVSDVSLKAEDVPNDLSFLVGLRQRLKLAGIGPRGLTVVGNKVYVAEYFSDTLSVVDLAAENGLVAKSLALGPKKEMDVVRKGEMLFNDATMCFQQWQSCASCHPGEARMDALNWDLLNDGIGNPKQTKSMLLSHVTAPAMISGIRESAEKAVRSGMKFILFAVMPEDSAVALDEYLKSLKPVSSPYLVNNKLSKAAKRGKKLFERAQCATCHPAPLYTDLKAYDVGTGKDTEKGKAFDTPTLAEIWRTAPYLYDGRAATMEEVLTKYNVSDMHGKTSNLSSNEVSDLAEYVLSL